MPSPAIEALLARLNPQQRQAATHDDRPLLIVAGAGTGKTATLVQRVAWLIARGVEPSRILLLTFTRRAAAEMLRRVDSLLRHLAAKSESPSVSLRGTQVWGGTFHAVATRLCAATGRPSACRPTSPSTTGPIPRTCSASSAPSWAWPRPTSDSPRREPAWRSTAAASTPARNWSRPWPASFPGAAIGRRT